MILRRQLQFFETFEEMKMYKDERIRNSGARILRLVETFSGRVHQEKA